MTETPPELPASLAAVWGVRARPGRGPKPGLTVERIVAAAVDVARREGLEAVSMGRVAGELSVSTMSLYRYVRAKDELLALIADAVLVPIPRPPEPTESWRDGLGRWARDVRSIYWRDRWVLGIPIASAPALPNQVRWMEQALRCLQSTPLSEPDKMSTLLLVSGFVRNEVVTMGGIIDARKGVEPSEHMMPAYRATMLQLINKQEFPAMWQALDSSAFDADDPPEIEFEFGLARILDGVEVLIKRHRSTKRAR